MRRRSPSERLLVEEVTYASRKVKEALRGLSIETFVKSIRTQLGMSQKALAKRSGLPQSTISRVEKDSRKVNLSTIQKIFSAMFCDLIMAPFLQDSIDSIRRKQARKIAEKHVRYLKGTMHLEGQQPDHRFIEELLKQEEERLLHSPNAKLWEE